MNKVAIIGIDSLDPYLLKKYKSKLPTFSKLIDESPTFISKSIFPTDTVPAWSSIYTGLIPSKHGILYVYDVFDPNLSDLEKIDISILKGKTFWEKIAKKGKKPIIVYPNLIYPAWDGNGVMISRSPFDKKLDEINTEIEVDVYPKNIRKKHSIPKKMKNIYGGFPGKNRMNEWAEAGLKSLKKEHKIALSLFENEDWDFYFVYYNLLDIIQHRFWRFVDKSDPTYPGKNELENSIRDFYIEFDKIVSDFIDSKPDTQFIIMSDHGHKMRPVMTLNINEFLRRKNIVSTRKKKMSFKSKLRKVLLTIITKLHLEPIVISVMTRSKNLTKMGKSVYSLKDSIDEKDSKAFLSNFAGIKSYSYGGIEINRKMIGKKYVEQFIEDLIKQLSSIKDNSGKQIVKWISKREDAFPGKYSKDLFPDIVFELEKEYAVGWDLHSELFGTAYDHKVASGGHSKEAVFLLKNIDRKVKRKKINIVDTAPTVLDLMGIQMKEKDIDGKTIF